MTFFKALAAALPDTAFDAALVLSPVNRRYVTGFPSSAGYVAVTPEKTVFITDFRYYGSACKAQSAGRIGAEIDIRLQDKTLWETLAALFAGKSRVLVEENYLTLAAAGSLGEKLAGFTFVQGASAALETLRAVKTPAELAAIERAQEITDEAFAYIVGYLSDHLGMGLTESAVALELEYYMRSNGADGIAFDTIAVNGAKSAMPHGVPAEVPLTDGFLTMDFGARFDGYCADMTRTVCIGKPTEKMRDVYDTVLGAQEQALAFIAAGKSGKSIDAVARDYIASRGYEGRFGHSLGHSLGLEIHENPNFSPSCDKPIPAGAVISVEPGVYLDGEFGVRIEDIVNITANGCKNLTKSPKELVIL
ncbi:MAG: M24 family metallopeptidase [Eubacteriales bacterium]